MVDLERSFGEAFLLVLSGSSTVCARVHDSESASRPRIGSAPADPPTSRIFEIAPVDFTQTVGQHGLENYLVCRLSGLVPDPIEDEKVLLAIHGIDCGPLRVLDFLEVDRAIHESAPFSIGATVAVTDATSRRKDPSCRLMINPKVLIRLGSSGGWFLTILPR